ncbi:MAG: SpoIIE family protein phosphatase [Candidatus Eremiobacteraeota bacterium]|nr:SpoIIE family protein phosphatase [Candidatus Eremiobacteraeota bacterium]
MYASIRRAIANLTTGEDSERHFNLAAERIQRALLDVSVPRITGAEIGVHAEPARLVGGDYIDLFASTDGTFVFGLGDASGKSLAAALNALMLRYLVRGLVTALGTEKLVPIVTYTNSVVADDMAEDAFITFLLAAFDATTGSLRVVNAGHEPPLIFSAATREVRTMDVHDIVLGIARETFYKQEETGLDIGDVAVFYTDGLTEATNDDGELFTIERLKRALLERAHLPAQVIAETIFDAVKLYSAGPLRDDATLLVLRRT